MSDLFTEQARRDPGAVAVSTGPSGEDLTYGELDQWSGRLAARLAEDGLQRGEPVGLLGNRCLAAPAGMLGILKAGGSYVPLDPADPAARIESLMRQLGIRRVVSLTEPGPDLGAAATYPVNDYRLGAESGGTAVKIAGRDRAYVLFTSGSTGTPKAVAVPHRAIARLVLNTNYVTFTPADRVANTGHPSFDASVFEIWGALLNGARVVVVDQATLPDPSRLAAFLREARISVMWLSAGVFHQSALSRPAMFGPVRYLITGGDVVVPAIAAQVLRRGRPGRLVNGYGPTENTTFSATYTIDEVPSGLARIPIGRPVANSTCYVVADDGSLAGPGEEGELVVGGDGVALGYLNDAALTSERFIPDPAGRRPGAMRYRTGDRARWLPDGNLDFLGRRDRMVKLRDFRIELDEVEAVLTGCPLVSQAAVGTEGTDPLTRAIVVYCTPASPAAQAPKATAATPARAGPPGPAAGATEPSEHVLPGLLRQYMAARLPSYMVPGRYIVLGHFPLTPAGKLDRVALAAAGAAARTSAAMAAPAAGPVETGLARLWEEALDVPHVGADSDFFDLGGNSLLAAQIFPRLQMIFGIGLEQSRYLTAQLLADPSLAASAEAVQAARTRSHEPQGTAPDFTREAELGFQLPVTGDVPAGPPRRILLTGGTGFLGSYLLRELLGDPDAHVWCLVRAPSAAEASARLAAAHARNGLAGLPAGRVTAVPGDLGQPLLGLSAAEFGSLARTLDGILHAGAFVNFTYPYAHLAPVTVGGTREIIRLASAYRGIPVHFVSSLALLTGYGAAGVRSVTEDTPLAFPEHLYLGYSETKWVTEALLANAARAGLAAAVYRPYEISGDTQRGGWNLENATCAMFRAIADTGCCPDIDLPLDFVPVDLLARQITHIFRTQPGRSATYHLANPRPAKVRDMADRLAAHGYPYQLVPLENWLSEMVRLVCAQPDHPFTPFVPMWADRSPRSGLTVKEMFFTQHFPVFSTERARAALAGAGIEVPPVDAAMLDSYIRFYQRAGFFPPPP